MNINYSDESELYDLFLHILDQKSLKYIAKELNIALGTVKRWSELKKVPKSYCFELLRLVNYEIDYTKFSFKEKDQFFTPKDTSQKCIDIFIDTIRKYGEDDKNFFFIEPSAGNGSFLNLLPIDRRIGLDIETFTDEIIETDFLKWTPFENHNYVVIGNPPFGLRGQLALKFINHASTFADYVAFILPQLFESDGKGVPRKRVIGLNLIHSQKLNTDFEDPSGNKIKVECIFQIWSKKFKNDEYNIKPLDETNLKIYSLSDGGTPSTTRNKKMFDKCDIYLPSTCFGKENMKFYINFNDLPRRKGYGIVFKKNKLKNLEKFKKINWSEVAFLSTNSAYNIRTSQIANMFS
jgi:hypothetical protein